jgi:hypothetical protein
MLGVSHPLNKPISASEPLAVVEQKHFALFHYVAIPDAPGNLGIKPEPTFDPTDPTDPMLGQHGATVLTELSTGGAKFARGELLSPDLVLSWPLKSRVALLNIGKIALLPSPKPAE